MNEIQALQLEYHQRRRDEERRKAVSASDARARRSHFDLAALHDLKLLKTYLSA